LKKAQNKRISHKKTNILINNLHSDFKLPLSKKSVMELVSKVMYGEDCAINEIIINFVKDSELKKINNRYLKHNYYTDIITFPYNDNKQAIDGELFISADTVRKNAEFYGAGVKSELKRVIIHGCLHLAGYDDRTKKQKELIRNKENYYLSIC
jgi:probable rRNA maturation factor